METLIHSYQQLTGVAPLMPRAAYGLHIGSYSQNNHTINLISTGLPTDFYIPAHARFKPEYALSSSIGYKGSFLKQKYILSAEIYFKQLYNSLECSINVLDLLYNNAVYTDFIYAGTGQNGSRHRALRIILLHQ